MVVVGTEEVVPVCLRINDTRRDTVSHCAKGRNEVEETTTALHLLARQATLLTGNLRFRSKDTPGELLDRADSGEPDLRNRLVGERNLHRLVAVQVDDTKAVRRCVGSVGGGHGTVLESDGKMYLFVGDELW